MLKLTVSFSEAICGPAAGVGM